jgi:hypothetical protein
LGVVCGYTFVAAIRVAALDKLDLCEYGIVVRRSWFWPWHELQVRYPASTAGGRIEFRRGWRRVTAIVPSTRLEAVKALCDEKLQRQSRDMQHDGNPFHNSSPGPSSGPGEEL